MLLIQVDDYLGVRVRVEVVTAGFEFRAQFGEVIDFAVEDHPNIAILVVNRLMPRRQVNDAQTPHSQPRTSVHVDSFIVRTSVHDGLAHLMDVRRFGRVRGFNADKACYATHDSCHSRVTSTNPSKKYKVRKLQTASGALLRS